MQYLCVTTPQAVRPTLLRQVDMGSLTCGTTLGAYRTHEGGSGTSAELGAGIEKLFLALPCQGIKPRVFRLEFQRSYHWATSPYTVSIMHNNYIYNIYIYRYINILICQALIIMRSSYVLMVLNIGEPVITSQDKLTNTFITIFL